MMKSLSACFLTVALVSAFAASSSHVTLFNQSSVDGKTLQAGEYKVEVKEASVVLKRHKDVVELPGKVETTNKKFTTSTVRYNDQTQIQEIWLGGTNKKIVFTGTSAAGTASKQSLR
jgi:Ethanolamine utilization protein EutJ (predicted chaperonin)